MKNNDIFNNFKATILSELNTLNQDLTTKISITEFQELKQIVSKLNALPSIPGTSAGTTETIEAEVVTDTPSGKQKYLVIVVAGQSNAVGYDESPITQDDLNLMSDRIKQLGVKGEDNLKYVPLRPCAQNFQDMATANLTNPASIDNEKGTKGIQLPLAAELIKHLDDDTNILIVPIAYGGTGFHSTFVTGTYDATTMKPSANCTQWGSTAPYYLALRDRLKKVLDDETIDAKFGGVVWCLGEFDGSKSNSSGLSTGFDAMLTQFTTDFASYSNKSIYGKMDLSTWFVYETIDYWYRGTTTGYLHSQQIWTEYRNKVGVDNYVAIPRTATTHTTNSNLTNGTGKTSSLKGSHYGNNAFRTIVAPAVAQKITNTKTDYYKNVNIITKSEYASRFVKLSYGNGVVSMSGNADSSFITNEGDYIVTSENGSTTQHIFKNALLFGNTYQIVCFKPCFSGIWPITSISSDRSTIGCVGFKSGNFGQRVTITNSAVSVKKSSTASVSLSPLDVVILTKCVNINQVQISYYSGATNTGIVGQTTTITNNGLPDVRMLGVVCNISEKTEISFAGDGGKRLILRPMGVASLDGLVAGNMPTSDEITNIGNIYNQL